jgi:hypothetical protein
MRLKVRQVGFVSLCRKGGHRLKDVALRFSFQTSFNYASFLP